MAAPAVPTNFNAQVGNGNAFLSWDQMSGATSYVIQRSQDNITFVTIATLSGTPLANSYLDQSSAVGGPTVGGSYFYQVQAVNGSGSSAFAAAIQAIVENIGVASLASMRLQAQQRADLVNSQFVSLTEWNSYVSLACKELYDKLLAVYAAEYYLQNTYTWTTDGSSQLYPLPADFYKDFLIEVALNPSDPNSWVTLKKYQRIQQNLYNYPNQYTMYGITNLRWRLTGNNLQLVPIASAGQTIRMWYAPRPKTLMADIDTFDGISGWEQYAIVRAAIMARMKEETDVTDLAAELQILGSRIDAIAENRDVGEPETVSDSRRRNFAWGEPGDGDGMGGWG